MVVSARERCKAHTLAVRGGNRCQRDTHKGGLCYQHWMATYKIRKERVKKLTIKQQRDKLFEFLKENSWELRTETCLDAAKLLAECEAK